MIKFNIKLKDGTGETRHAQISRQLIELIQAGKLIGGTVLPGEATLAAQIGTSRKTIRSAYQQLESDGLVGRTATGTRIVGGTSQNGKGNKNQQANKTGNAKSAAAKKTTTKSPRTSPPATLTKQATAKQAAKETAKHNVAAKSSVTKNAKASSKK